MTPAERGQLLDALLEGEISDADFLRLEAELSVDPDARREYYNRVTLSMLLQAEAGESWPFSQRPRDASQSGRTSWFQSGWAFAAIGAVVAALLMIVTWPLIVPRGSGMATNHNSKDSRAGIETAESLASGYAVISGQAEAVWGDGQVLADGSFAPSGELHLRSGVVEFELFSGVTLVVEGESRFTIQSSMQVDVAIGKVRARVPEPATGFRVTTNRGDIVDLGTEFAVDVTEVGQEVHVLDGEVEWHPQGEIARRMEQGQATRLTDTGQNLFEARPEFFVGPEEMRERMQLRQASRLDRWSQLSERLRGDPRLAAYYRVTASDVSTRRLPNLGESNEMAASEGAVVAAAPASNRWGQHNSAMDFSPSGSRVRLSVPGEHRSLTLLCWVRINSLDRWYNSLFLTDGHEEGEPHWQIMDDGRLFFSVKKRDQFDRSKGEMDKHIFYSPPFWKGELSGQWLMIATVYDVESRQVSHFLNGYVLSQETIPTEYLVESVRIGNASIGNWGLPERSDPKFAVRNLNGSIDEFALFSAALSAQEIRQLYDNSKP